MKDKLQGYGASLFWHIVVLGFVLFGVQWSVETVKPVSQSAAVEPLAATAMPSDQVQAEIARLDRMEEQKKQKEKQKLEDAQKQLQIAQEKRIQEEKKLEALKLKQAEAAKEAERLKKEQAQQEALKKKELALQEAQKKREESLQKSLLEEQEQAKLQAEILRIAGLMQQKMNTYWIKPYGSNHGLQCLVEVHLAPQGEVLQVRIARSSGNPAFDQSAEVAVQKASPLPVPSDPKIGEHFRQFTFTFRPEVI